MGCGIQVLQGLQSLLVHNPYMLSLVLVLMSVSLYPCGVSITPTLFEFIVHLVSLVSIQGVSHSILYPYKISR